MDWKKVKRFVLDLFYPNRCPFCSEFIRWDMLACDECIENLPLVPDNICLRCGKFPCECEFKKYSFDYCYCVCIYEGAAKQGILSLKYRYGINAAELFSDILTEKLKRAPEFDIIIPVPMTSKKKRERTYNQAELIADFISKKLNKPVKNNVLNKCKNLPEQHTLTAEERIENAKKMFYAGNTNLSGKNILLCDDVMTTGSTLHECSEILKSLGAALVICAVCASTEI